MSLEFPELKFPKTIKKIKDVTVSSKGLVKITFNDNTFEWLDSEIELDHGLTLEKSFIFSGVCLILKQNAEIIKLKKRLDEIENQLMPRKWI